MFSLSVRLIVPLRFSVRFNSSTAAKIHWFYATDVPVSKPVEFEYIQSERPKKFLPFAKYDSEKLEETYQELVNGNSNPDVIPVNEDNLFECDLRSFVMRPTYWNGAVYEIRRGLWFYDKMPLPGAVSEQVEQIFASGEDTVRELRDELEYVTEFGGPFYVPTIPDHDLSVNQVAIRKGKDMYLFDKDSKLVKLQMDLVGGATVPAGGKKLVRGYQDDPEPKKKNAETTPVEGKPKSESKSIIDTVKGDWLGWDNSNKRFEAEVSGDYSNIGKTQNSGDRKVEHLVFCVHGIGQSLGTKIDSVNFIHTCNNLRKGMKKVYKDNKPLHQLAALGDPDADTENCKVQVLPIIWRYNAGFSTKQAFQEEGERRLPTLDDITVDNIKPIRSVLGDVFLDILLYYIPEYKTRILENVIEQANTMYEKYLEKHPDFNGDVSLVGHSLGSAIFFDILASQPDKVDRLDKKRHLMFDVENYFACGSPVSVFKLLNKTNIGARSEKSVHERKESLRVNSFYNIFYSADPVAYRCEPLIDLQMKDYKPQTVTPTSTQNWLDSQFEALSTMGGDIGNKIKGNVNTILKDFGLTKIQKDTMPEDLKQKLLRINRNGRIDYCMPESMFELSIVSALDSHIQYFEDEDFADFLLQELYKSK